MGSVCSSVPPLIIEEAHRSWPGVVLASLAEGRKPPPLGISIREAVPVEMPAVCARPLVLGTGPAPKPPLPMLGRACRLLGGWFASTGLPSPMRAYVRTLNVLPCLITTGFQSGAGP